MSEVGGESGGGGERGGNGEGGTLPWTFTTGASEPTIQKETIEVPVSKESNSNSKKPNHRCRKLLGELLQEFAKNTGLHGPRYTTLQGLSLVEKIFWIIAFLLSLILCIILILEVWGKWNNSSTIVTFSEHHMHVSEVPFPAVTICPKAKIDQQTYNYTKNTALYFRSDSEDWYDYINDSLGMHERFKLNKIRLICNYFVMADSREFWFWNFYHDVKDIIEAAPKLNQIFLNGSWQDERLNITQGDITEVLMEEGVCFTFNSLAAAEILNMERIHKNYSYSNASKPSKEWDLGTGYLTDLNGDSYPRRGRSAVSGASFPFSASAAMFCNINLTSTPIILTPPPMSKVGDLQLYLQENITCDKLCNGDVRGFKVYLHHPADLPQSSMFYYTVLPDYDISMSIVVDVLKPSIFLRKCPLHIRKCYFAGEKVLMYFKLYSQNNCRLECLTNYTKELCGCIWFHMPSNLDDQSMFIQCTYAHKYCLKRALETLVSEESDGNMVPCRCLPSCSSVQYRADIYKNNNPRDGRTFIDMYFRDSSFISRTRECSGMFELMDFLAYCGGLLGLFLGFSFLSLVEILYFCTLRLFCMFRRDSKAKIKKEKRTKQKRMKKF